MTRKQSLTAGKLLAYIATYDRSSLAAVNRSVPDHWFGKRAASTLCVSVENAPDHPRRLAHPRASR